MSKVQKVYLLLGPERGEKERFIQTILDSLSSLNSEAPETHKMYSFERSIHEAISLLRNGSLFTKGRVVLYEGVETLKQKAEMDALHQYVQAPAADGVLLLLSDRTSVDKKLQTLIPDSQKIVFWELYEQKKKEWIQSFFQQKGISISPDGIDLLLELVENNTRDFQQVCSQLADFYKGEKNILPEHIEEILYHSKQETVYTLFEHILAGEMEASLEILHKLLLEGESQSVGILISLTYQLRSFREYLRLRRDNFHPGDACIKLKIFSKKTQRVYGIGEKRYSLEKAENMIALCADFDEYLRFFRSDLHPLLLELFLYGLIKKGGQNPLGAAEFFFP